MQSASDLLGLAGGKPKLITRITSGTGTYVPTADMARCLVRIQGGGGGGYNSGGSAGSGGAMVEVMIRIPIAGLAYAVGAGGAVNTSGSASTFGAYKAPGGRTPNSGTVTAYGGMLGSIVGSVDADSVTSSASSPMPGVCGGAGGYTYSGNLAGWPVGESGPDLTGSFGGNYAIGNGPFASNGQGAGSGGNSFYGVGGTSGNSPAAGNYGAGGGYNAAGLGGCIEIWDFGA